MYSDRVWREGDKVVKKNDQMRDILLKPIDCD